MKVSETAQGETPQEWKVGETASEVNGKTGETVPIRHCRNTTMNISPSKWYGGHTGTNTA